MRTGQFHHFAPPCNVIIEVSNTDFDNTIMGDFNYHDIDWVHNSVKPGATVLVLILSLA